MPVEIPAPITFNSYKHHFRFLLSELDDWRQMEWSSVNAQLLSIGNNLLDFYLGDLDVDEIVYETLQYFNCEGIDEYAEFLEWLNPPKWKKITLSDHSEWLIKKGDDPERYTHIHPAKYSTHTIRVRATTLKTVLALESLALRIDPVSVNNLNVINRVRKNYLKLSPIKSLRKGESGILRLWELFQNYPCT
ncbi:hypothetical protein [Maribellus mangrovi]|uniref:hypothetical protein n=1 Tax=Maribellus mangrovi TaxID=3133146 RepID=UPI0030EB1D04